MTGTIENHWERAEKSAQIILEESKRAHAIASKLLLATKHGVPKGAAKSAAQLDDAMAKVLPELADLKESLHALEAHLSIEGLITEIEQAIRSSEPDARLIRGYNRLVRFPETISLSGNGLEIRVTIDKESAASCRPSVVAATTGRAIDHKTAERFARTLHGAFKVLNKGNETGRSSLTALHEVLDTSPPGVPSYSLEEFRIDLQRLRAVGLDRVSETVAMSWGVSASGKSAISLIERSGDIINVGYVEFTRV